MQDTAIGEEGMIQTDKLHRLCGTYAPPVADLQKQELQAWHQCTAAQLLVRFLSAMIAVCILLGPANSNMSPFHR